LPGLDRRRVWVCSTHTHDSPDTIGLWGPMIAGVPLRSGLDHAYMEFLIERTADAARRAVSDLRPAKLIVAAIQTPNVGLSRNVRQDGLKDDQVQALQFVDRHDRPIATAYHYACHPEFLGHSNRWISAEWPGVTGALLEKRFGGVAALFQNALGGMVTGAVSRDDGSFDPVVGQPFVPALGRRIASFVEKALAENGRPAVVDGLVTAQRAFDLPVTNRLFRACARLNVLPRWMIDRRGQSVRTEVNLARFGPVALATVPGEALPEVGFAVKRQLNAPYAWVLNLANDELGYLLSPNCWQDPRYGYERSMSVGPHAVPEIEKHLARLPRELA
jgi:hypothetical protein